MSYKYSKGSQVIGDLKAADDTQRDTLIDFGQDQIEFQTSGSTRLKVDNNGIEVTGDMMAGPQGKSLRISGSNFISSSVDVYSGNGTGNYSVSLWFKSAAQVDDNRIIFTLANSNARSTVREKGGFLQFLNSADDNSTCVSTINYYPAQDNNWNFLTFVSRQNGSDIETTASLNGAITDSDTVAGKTAIMNYANGSVRKLQIGGYTNDSDTIANEIFIRDFILWNGSLTTSDIATLYNSGNYYDFSNFTTFDKLAWIKPDDLIGTSYNSNSSISNFGTIGGSFEIADYNVGEVNEISSDAPFTTEHLLETDYTNNRDVLINGGLTVHNYTFPTSDGSNGQILQTNGSGQLSFADVDGGSETPEVLKVGLNSDLTLQTGTYHTLALDVVQFDTFTGGAGWNTGSYNFVATEAGYYDIQASLVFDAIQSDITQYQIYLVSSSSASTINSAGVPFLALNQYNNNPAQVDMRTFQIGTIAHFSTNQSASIQIHQVGGTSNSTKVKAGSNISYVTIKKL